MIFSEFTDKLAFYEKGEAIPTGDVIKQALRVSEEMTEPAQKRPDSAFFEKEYSHEEIIDQETEKIAPPVKETFVAVVGSPDRIMVPENIPVEKEGGNNKEFVRFLKQKNFRESRKCAVKSILSLWQYEAKISDQQNSISSTSAFLDSVLEPGRFEMILLERDLSLLKKLNVPAVVRFKIADMSSPRYYTLTGIAEDSVTLLKGEGEETISVSEDTFMQFWTGEIYIPWRNFFGIKGMVPQGSPGYSVALLKALLVQKGETGITIDQHFDEATEQAVRKFQKLKKISSDGIVGPITKIMLYNELGYLQTPHLVKRSEKTKSSERTKPVGAEYEIPQ